MDFIGLTVQGDLLSTIVNVISFVVALDFVSNFAYALRFK